MKFGSFLSQADNASPAVVKSKSLRPIGFPLPPDSLCPRGVFIMVKLLFTSILYSIYIYLSNILRRLIFYGRDSGGSTSVSTRGADPGSQGVGHVCSSGVVGAGLDEGSRGGVATFLRKILRRVSRRLAQSF